MRVKRSSYTPHIIDNPALLSAVRDTARRRFEEKDLTFKSFAKYKLTELLKRRVKAMESQEKRDREGNLLAFLQSDDLFLGSVEKLTVEVLKGAVVTWQQSIPHVSALLRRNGTKEALMRQFRNFMDNEAHLPCGYAHRVTLFLPCFSSVLAPQIPPLDPPGAPNFGPQIAPHLPRTTILDPYRPQWSRGRCF